FGGTLGLGAGATVNAPIVDVEPLGSFYASGHVVGDLDNHGILIPGDFLVPGTINLTGDFIQTGELLMDVSAFDAFDKVAIDGVAPLGGGLAGNSSGISVADAGHTLTILSAESVHGSFDWVLFPDIPGLDFDLLYPPASVDLRISRTTIPGDFDHDGD